MNQRNPLNPKSWMTLACLSLLCLLVGLILQHSFLTYGLWLDETVSYWVSSGTFFETIDRAWKFQGQSPVYFVLLWAWLKIFGNSELLMRIPSLIAVGMSAWMLFKLARKFVEVPLAGLAIGFYLSSTFVQHCLSARPYAFGLLCVISSVYFLFGALEHPTRRNVIWYGIATTLAGYFHVLFSTLLIFELIWLLYFRRMFNAVTYRSTFKVLLAAIILQTIPVAQILQLFEQNVRRDFARPVTLDLARQIILPPYLIQAWFIAFIAGVILSFVWKRGVVSSGHNERRLLAHYSLIASWAILPTFTFFILSKCGIQLFLPRYLVWHVPGLALLLTILIPRRTTYAVAAAGISGLIFLIYSETSRSWTWESWQESIQSINLKVTPDTPVLLSSGLVEGRSSSWLADPTKQGFLLSPVSRYPLKAKTVISIPPSISNIEQRDYVAEVAAHQLNQNDFAMLLIDWTPEPSKALSGYQQFFEVRGYEVSSTRRDGVLITAFFHHHG